MLTEDIDRENVVMRHFFMHVADKNEVKQKDNNTPETFDEIENILTAQRALLYIDPESGGRIFKIENGSRYDNNKTNGEFSVFTFKEHGIHIPALKIDASTDLEAESITQLLKNGDLESQAEIHWRIAIIMSAPVMALLAFPLSYTTPRQGRFGKLAVGILLYAIYVNLIMTGVSMIEDGKIPNWLGLWWVHLSFILLALWLVRQRYSKV